MSPDLRQIYRLILKQGFKAKLLYFYHDNKIYRHVELTQYNSAGHEIIDHYSL